MVHPIGAPKTSTNFRGIALGNLPPRNFCWGGGTLVWQWPGGGQNYETSESINNDALRQHIQITSRWLERRHAKNKRQVPTLLGDVPSNSQDGGTRPPSSRPSKLQFRRPCVPPIIFDNRNKFKTLSMCAKLILWALLLIQVWMSQRLS